MSSGHPDRVLLRFRNLVPDEIGLLSNARCLGEGVDVPPLDGVAFIVAYFRYASGSDNPVRVELSGCMTATTGHMNRTAGIAGTTIVDKLEALVHPEPVRPGSRSKAARIATIDGYLRLCGGPAPGRCFIARSACAGRLRDA